MNRCRVTLLPLVAVLSVRLLAQSQAPDPAACFVRSATPDATIAACTPYIKAERKHLAHCHDEMIWESSTLVPAGHAIDPILPSAITPDCSVSAAVPLVGHHSHNGLSVAPGYESPPPGTLVDALGARADAYAEKLNFFAAIEDYNDALAIQHNDPSLLYRRGEAYHALHNSSHAIDDFTASLKSDPNNPETLAARCRERAIAGQIAKALGDCDASLQTSPANARALSSRGLIYLKQKRFDQALAAYEAALHESPKAAGALYGRGLAKRALGDALGSSADLAAALKLNPAVGANFRRYKVHIT